jgi:hypothetical protein
MLLNVSTPALALVESTSLPSIANVAFVVPKLFEAFTTTLERSYDPFLIVVVNETSSELDPSNTTSLLALEVAIVASDCPVISSLAAVMLVDSTALP